jgi:hypothetical protein
MEVDEFLLSLERFTDRDYTKVEVCAPTSLHVSGSAKRTPDDSDTPELAWHLACSRAFYKLARKHERQANGLVRHQEWVAEQKAKRRSKPVIQASPDESSWEEDPF